MNKNVELLAPAGSYDAFIAAVENGANAVYLGGKLFNARANASNFDLDELKKICDYAHLRDVKIHVTINTLLNDNELKDALNFAYDIYKIGVDAIIVQDLGFAKLVHENIPNLSIHASTQLSTHNLEGVNELKKLGFSRVVLARELSIKEIKYICDNTDTEIEIFSHGAQCICYSGECLFSSMIGDRSGNRGKCAQPCRMPYELVDEKNNSYGKGYLLSPKDLATLEILKELPNVACLKIEGRMKSPEYVATVVNIYRKYLDNLSSIPSQDDKQNLAQIFNRGGFSTAYLKNKTGSSVMCYEKPKNWGIYIGKVKKINDKYLITISNDNNVDLVLGDGIEVWNGQNESPSTIISSIQKVKNGFIVGRISGKINIDDKVYRTSSSLLNQQAKESYKRGFKRHKLINVSLLIEALKPIEVKIDDFIYTSDIIPELAQKSPTSKEKITEQFSKTGNTPFEINKLVVKMTEQVFIPISTINELRREALDAYSNYLLEQYSLNIKDLKIDFEKIFKKEKNGLAKNNKKEISMFLNIFKEEFLKIEKVDNYYFNFKDVIKNADSIKNLKKKKYALFPTITKGKYEKFIKDNIDEVSKVIDGWVISNIGQLDYFVMSASRRHTNQDIENDIGNELIANYTLNTFNIETVKLLKKLGFTKVILSPELTKNQINHIVSYAPKGIKIEAISYGNICVMISEYCPVGSIIGGFCKEKACSKPCLKNEKYYLKDRMNMNFRVLPDNIDCQSKIFNSKINSINTNELLVDSYRIDILDESFDEAQEAINSCISGKKLSGDKYTNGHFVREV